MDGPTVLRGIDVLTKIISTGNKGVAAPKFISLNKKAKLLNN